MAQCLVPLMNALVLGLYRHWLPINVQYPPKTALPTPSQTLPPHPIPSPSTKITKQKLTEHSGYKKPFEMLRIVRFAIAIAIHLIQMESHSPLVFFQIDKLDIPIIRRCNVEEDQRLVSKCPLYWFFLIEF